MGPVRHPSLVRLVDEFGGRWSTELGIDVDGDDREIDRWFVAATLFGTRISATIAVRTYTVLEGHHVSTLDDVAACTWDDLVTWLDEGGYARYDFRTATRLLDLSRVVAERHGSIHRLGRAFTDPRDLERALDALPGWGPTTVQIFLRELRGVWPGAQPALGDRFLAAAEHLHVFHGADTSVADLIRGAKRASLDPRDVEAALARASLRHHGSYAACPGGMGCVLLSGPS